jgi:ribose 5-phosphate isomerase A
MSETDRQKRIAAQAAVAQVVTGMRLGLGTGSTVEFVLELLGERVQQGFRISGVPTSQRTAERARELGIEVEPLDPRLPIDLTIDGADQVQRGTLALIKGHGGALLREKLVAVASRRVLIVVDQRKPAPILSIPIPVEVVRFGWETTADRLRDLGAAVEVETRGGPEPFLTEEGHYLLHCAFGPLENPSALAAELDRTVGVVEHGLFLGIASQVIVGVTGGVRLYEAQVEGM